jgi:hypothetical protein
MKTSSFIFLNLLFYLYFQLNAQTVAFRINEKDLIPEGIAHDSLKNEFYLSSIHKNKIIKFSAKKPKTDFIKSGEDGFGGGLGLHIDSQNRLLYACWGDIIGKKYRSGIFVYHLDNRKLIKSFEFSLDTIPHFFNDLTIHKNGMVYITNTFDHSIWVWKKEENKPSKIRVNQEIKYPNGICLSDDKQLLFVADANSLVVIHLEKNQAIKLEVFENEFSTKSLDGIVFYKNSILAVQNIAKDKTKHKILRYFLDSTASKIEKTQIIDANNPFFDIPTTLVLANNQLYGLANSQMEVLDEQKKIKSKSKLKKTYILRYSLE